MNARRSIVILKDMNKGDILKNSSLILKRPGTGLPAGMISKVIGKKLKKDLKA